MSTAQTGTKPYIAGGSFRPPASMLECHARERPDQTAVVAEDCRLTYGELWQEVFRLATGMLQLGLRRGDRVLLMMPMCPEGVVGYWALSSIGAVAVAVDPQAPTRDLEYFAELTEADYALCIAPGAEVVQALRSARADLTVLALPEGEPGAPELRRWDFASSASTASSFRPVEVEETEPAVVTFTSGTTSRPKGVLHTYASVLSQHEVVRRDWRLSPRQVVMNPLPFYTIFGILTMAGATVFSGATLVLLGRFSPERMLETIERDRVTTMAAVPTMYIMAMNYEGRGRYDLTSLEVAYTSGAAMTEGDMECFSSWSGVNLLAAYGMSECAVAAFEPSTGPHRPLAAGKFGAGFRWRVVDDEGRDLPAGEVGELVMTGPTVMAEYVGMPEESAKRLRDGWIFSGDVASVDDDGYIYLAGRRADIIIRGGLNIAPIEVESVLTGHPDVHMAVVVGVEDEVFGQRVKACVVPTQGADLDTLRHDLLELCRSQLAEQKVPEYLEFYDDLPRNANGKVMRNMLTGRSV